jgi:HSP20 family molecular chaperone IbpA
LEVASLLFGDHYRFFGARFQILPAVLRPSRTLAQRGVFASEADITEAGKEIRVSAELAGLEKKDVEVNVTADTLRIAPIPT